MPDSHPQDSPDYSGLPGSGHEDAQAADAVRAVTAWYAASIGAESSKPDPDPDRIARWSAALKDVGADRNRLWSAGPEEAAEIAARYRALLRELTGR